jgi:integrase
MKWEDISLERAEWRIPETKNGESQLVPLVPSAVEILKAIKEENDSGLYSEYVFPSKSKSGHYADPKRAWKRILERATIEIWKEDKRLDSLIEEVEEKLKDKQVYNEFNEIKKEAQKQDFKLPKGITDLRLHDLRRTLGSYQASLGANSFIIGKSLGHKS